MSAVEDNNSCKRLSADAIITKIMTKKSQEQNIPAAGAVCDSTSSRVSICFLQTKRATQERPK
eukprot:4106483-Amphidinium_carterae.1